MNQKERPTIKTERLTLRPFALDDLDDLLEYTKDPEWAKYQVNIPPVPYSRKDAETLIAMFSDPAQWMAIGMLQMFAIVSDGKVIGEIYLNQREDDRKAERIEIGYSLSRLHWGKGLATEAALAVLDWAIRNYNPNKIYATLDPRNVRSYRVLEKLGMRREGVLRSHLKWNDEFRDQAYYGILRDEWLLRTKSK